MRMLSQWSKEKDSRRKITKNSNLAPLQLHISVHILSNSTTMLNNCGVWNGQLVDNVRFEGGQPIVHSSSVDNGETQKSSNSSYVKRNTSLTTRPRRRLHPSNPSKTDDYDEKSLQDVPEGNTSTKWDDMKSVDERSALSSNSTPTSGQRKRVIKDEIKFIVTRFVPTRLRKSKLNKSVTLERSEGCLT
jgi:hypothetical protein